ncbi:MAG: DinB family protein [Microscillaceae bacterium]|jgi:hypothetical protein|nr:DinB family protein [Microscillaceae bacterium]
MENPNNHLNKEQISQSLTQAFQQFVAWLDTISEAQFNENPPQKWSIAQNLEHLIKSAKPVRALLGKPASELTAFGKPFAPEKTYQEIVEIYLKTLQKPVVNTTFAPNEAVYKPADLRASFLKELDLLLNHLALWQESDLDLYAIPHPLIGNLSVRQMLYFTAYHTLHHLSTLQKRWAVS